MCKFFFFKISTLIKQSPTIRGRWIGCNQQYVEWGILWGLEFISTRLLLSVRQPRSPGLVLTPWVCSHHTGEDFVVAKHQGKVMLPGSSGVVCWDRLERSDFPPLYLQVIWEHCRPFRSESTGTNSLCCFFRRDSLISHSVQSLILSPKESRRCVYSVAAKTNSSEWEADLRTGEVRENLVWPGPRRSFTQ